MSFEVLVFGDDIALPVALPDFIDAVEARYGIDEAPVTVYLEMLGTVEAVCNVLHGGSVAPEAVNAMSSHMARLLIFSVRLVPKRNRGNRLVIPFRIQSSHIRSFSEHDWVNLVIGRGPVFARTPYGAGREISEVLPEVIADCAAAYGVDFHKVMEIALSIVREP